MICPCRRSTHIGDEIHRFRARAHDSRCIRRDICLSWPTYALSAHHCSLQATAYSYQLNNLRVPTAPPHDSCPDAKQYIQVRSVRQLVGGRVETYPPTCPDNGGCLACWRRNGMESSPQAVRVRPFQTCTRIRSGGKRCSSAVCVFVSDADGTDEKNHLRSGEALWLAGEMCVRGGQCRSTSVAVAGGPGRAGGGHAHGAYC